MTDKQDTSGTYWVGLGASAGGLEALRTIAKNLIPGVDAIYVVVQHMSPGGVTGTRDRLGCG